METPEDDNQGELPNAPDTDNDKLLESKEDSAESHAEDDDADTRDVSKTSPDIKKAGSSSKDPSTPSERPTRERKLVKRYTESSTTRASVTKPVLIDQGRGSQLKDIPNVAFKLSKRKPDDNLQTLHSVMFGKRAKVHNLKKNLGMFSGYVWIESEHEKQRGKVKEKLDKCIKEKLVDFCDVFNIPIHKANSKKEDLCSKLLEFLECPHATTENLLSDKEKKGKKRKAKAAGGIITGSAEAVSETPTKKPKKNSQGGEKKKRASETEEEDKVVGGDDAQGDNGGHDSDSDESNTNVESDHVNKPDLKPELEEDDSKSAMPAEENSSKKIPKSENSVKESSPAKSSKKSANKTASSRNKKNKVKEETEKDVNVVVAKERKPRKKKESDKKTSTKKNKSNKEKVEAQIEKKTTLSAKGKTSKKNQASTSSAMVLENDSENGKKEPNRAEMHVVAQDIIKEADFNKVTLGDVVKQLGSHFGVDLMSRRGKVKGIIGDILNSMSDDDESDSEDEKKDC